MTTITIPTLSILPDLSGAEPDRDLGPGPRRGGASPGPLTFAALEAVADTVMRTMPWWKIARHEPAGRHPVRLLATPDFDVWVIGWMQGQSTSLHDHGGSSGVFLVVEGTLTETVVCGSMSRRSRVGAGSLRRLPASIVHNVADLSPSPASSIHVYSPPLTQMGYYAGGRLDATDAGQRLKVTEPVLGVDPFTLRRLCRVAASAGGGGPGP